ncbi:MAG: hypothetical protein IJH12_08770 [Clostridia bacterium]|nr:hypothetical protein [Clostridia bacterium]
MDGRDLYIKATEIIMKNDSIKSDNEYVDIIKDINKIDNVRNKYIMPGEANQDEHEINKRQVFAELYKKYTTKPDFYITGFYTYQRLYNKFCPKVGQKQSNDPTGDYLLVLRKWIVRYFLCKYANDKLKDNIEDKLIQKEKVIFNQVQLDAELFDIDVALCRKIAEGKI